MDINASKLKFCWETVDFARLTITLLGITPFSNIIYAIKNFLTLID